MSQNNEPISAICEDTIWLRHDGVVDECDMATQYRFGPRTVWLSHDAVLDADGDRIEVLLYMARRRKIA